MMTVLLILLLLPRIVWSATYYVATTGNNGNSCASAQNGTTARQTITAGIACLSGGDTLIVKSGIYDELLDDLIPSGSSGAPTTVRSEVKGGAIIQPSSGRQSQLIDGVAIIMFGTRAWITLDGLVIDMNNLYNSFGIGDRNGSSPDHVSLINLEIKNGHDHGYPENTVGIASQPLNTNAYIAGNHIHHIGDDATIGTNVAGQQSYGLYFTGQNGVIEFNDVHHTGGYCLHQYNNVSSGSGSGSKGNTIRNNRFHHCGLTPFGQESILLAAGGSNNLLYNNLIYNGAKSAIFVGLFGVTSVNNNIYNNTIYANGEWCIRYGSDNLNIRNNICYANGNNTILQVYGTGGIVDHNLLASNPLFVNAAGADFHLQAGSPAIDTGVTIASVPNDFELNPRGAIYDLGAYEYFVQAPPSPTLLAWWKLDEGTGTSAADATGNAHTATLGTGLTWQAGKVGGSSLTCDALHAASATTPLPSSGNYTYMFWAKGTTAPATSGPNQLIVHNGASSDSYGFAWGCPTAGFNQAANQKDASGNYVAARLTTPLQANQWYHVSVTWDGTALRAYLNGQLQASSPISTMTPASGAFEFCGSTGGTGTYFPGQIDHLKVWNFALTAAQVAGEYTATVGTKRKRVMVR